MNQNNKLLEMMKSGWVSPLDALKWAGSFRLSARVSDLKEMGHDLESKWVLDPETGKRWKSWRVSPCVKQEALFK